MTRDELKEKYCSKKLEGMKFVDLVNVNFKPHPFTLGSFASKHGNQDDLNAMNSYPCCHPGCNLSYKEHTFDLVLKSNLTRNVTNKTISESVYAIKEEMEDDMIDGLVFIENKYKIVKE